MSRKVSYITEACKIFLNCLAVALSFIKIFHEVAVLPGEDANGGFITTSIDYFYSVYDKFSRESLLPFLGVSLALLVASSAASVLSIVIKDGAKLKLASHIVFGLSATVFLAVMIVAAGIRYCY